MPPTMHRRQLVRLSVAVFLLAAIAKPASAVDEQAAFVEALRKQGYHELALDYLDGAEQRGLTSDAFRKRLAYERAVTRLDQVRKIKNADRRDAALQAAASDLKAFTSKSSDKRLAAEAEGRLAGAFVNSAKLQLARAAPLREGPTAGDAAPMLKSARVGFDAARKRYAAAERLYEEALEKFKSVEPNSPEAKERLELRGALSQMRLLNGRVLYQKASTHKPGSQPFKSLNKQAAEELAGFYEKYSRWLVGLYAHLYEGQAYLALKQYKLAAGCFEDLIAQPADDPTFRRLITLAHASLAETRIAQGELEPALRDGRPWYDGLRSGEDAGPDAMALAYQLGRAAMMLAETEEGPGRKQRLSEARAWLQDASRSGSEFQLEARSAFNTVNETLGRSDRPIDTFDDAYQKMRDAVASFSFAKQAAKIAGKNNAAGARELEADAAADRQRALSAIGDALRLSEDTTPLAKLNEVRSSLAFLLWEAGDYLGAAVVGEFLATQYPSDPSAEQAANLAIASLQRLYQASRDAGDDGRFESDRLAGLTESVIKTWPGTKTAAGASSVLVSLALRDNRLDDARRVIGEVAPANRPALELQLASAVWEQALRRLAAAEPGERKSIEQEKLSAAEMLAAAFDQARDQRPATQQLATAALYLAQSHLDAGRPDDAIAVLEDGDVGPLTLLSQSAAATSRQGYAAEAYKLALRTYVSLNPPRTDDALRTMKRLEKAVRADGGDAATQRAKLTRIYFGLGVQLQREMKALNDRGQSAKARRLGTAFAAFLENLDKQAADADWTTRQWIGQTYLQLADGLGDGDQATEYRSKARDAFVAMIDRAKQTPSYAPKPTSVLAARMQLGQAHRKLGEYQAALDIFSSILLEREASLEVQKAAAYTLQEWGADTDASQLDNAIRGSRLDPQTKKNVVWGWNKLGKVAASVARKRPEYKDLFFESWLNIATCRYLAAEQATGSERDKQLASARRTLRGMVRQYPDLGGADRRKEFDAPRQTHPEARGRRGGRARRVQHVTKRFQRDRDRIPMKRFLFSTLCLCVMATAAVAQTDQVRASSGNVAGQVTDSSPVSVTVTRGSTEKKVSVADITSVQFGGEPSELRQARVNYRNGGYKLALQKLRQIDDSDIDNPFITTDIEYYTAVSEAKLALLGEGAIAEAGGKLNRFLRDNNKSFHWLSGTEVLGDLLVAAGRYGQAAERYRQLDKAPWPSYKIRAGVLLGEVSQAKGDHAAAIKQFDKALAIDDDSKKAATPKLRARLGRAVSLAATGSLDEGVALVQEVIKESDPEARKLNASAYNALGNCYREAGRAKDAAFAYLHVDLLYASVPEARAEALYHLGSLLDEIGERQQAREARQKLKQQYADSEWAKK